MDKPYTVLRDGYFLVPEKNIDKLGEYIADKLALADSSAIENCQCKALEDACDRLGIMNSTSFDKYGELESFTLCDFNHRYEVRR